MRKLELERIERDRIYREKKRKEKLLEQKKILENICECSNDNNIKYICQNCKKKKYSNFWKTSGYIK